MSILIEGARTRRRAPAPSVREVCLLGNGRQVRAWSSGDCVTLSGRVYRIAATQVGSEGADGAARYVHLAAER